jgi:hypothetical protein
MFKTIPIVLKMGEIVLKMGGVISHVILTRCVVHLPIRCTDLLKIACSGFFFTSNKIYLEDSTSERPLRGFKYTVRTTHYNLWCLGFFPKYAQVDNHPLLSFFSPFPNSFPKEKGTIRSALPKDHVHCIESSCLRDLQKLKGHFSTIILPRKIFCPPLKRRK